MIIATSNCGQLEEKKEPAESNNSEFDCGAKGCQLFKIKVQFLLRVSASFILDRLGNVSHVSFPSRQEKQQNKLYLSDLAVMSGFKTLPGKESQKETKSRPYVKDWVRLPQIHIIHAKIQWCVFVSLLRRYRNVFFCTYFELDALLLAVRFCGRDMRCIILKFSRIFRRSLRSKKITSYSAVMSVRFSVDDVSAPLMPDRFYSNSLGKLLLKVVERFRFIATLTHYKAWLT